MTILIFDTETVNLTKPYCYNVGYIIYDTDTKETLIQRDYIVSQIWHNKPLFDTAYYANKRPLYVSYMRGRKAKLTKWGYVIRRMISDIKKWDVTSAYAFNSPFDDRTFRFNCNYYHTRNPFETLPIYDIRKYAGAFLYNGDYSLWVEQQLNEHPKLSEKFITPGGNYATTAESFYAYMIDNANYQEEHTALQDSIIELHILLKCIDKGAVYNLDYDSIKLMPRQE